MRGQICQKGLFAIHTKKSNPGLLYALIVDDDPVCRMFCSTVLSQAGFRVFTASNGRTAVAQAITHQPELVLIDLHLPDITGQEAAERICGSWPKTHAPCLAIAITGCDKGREFDPSHQALFHTTLHKPFLAECLIQAIQAVMPIKQWASGAHADRAIKEPRNSYLKLRFQNELKHELAVLDQAITALNWRKSEKLVHRLAGAAALANCLDIARSGRQLSRALSAENPAREVAEPYLEFLQQAADLSLEPGCQTTSGFRWFESKRPFP